MENNIDELVDYNERDVGIFKFCPDAIMIQNEGTVVYANTAAAKLLESESADCLVGKKIMSFVHSGYENLVKAREEEIYKKKCKVPFIEQKVTTCKGNIIDIEVSSGPFLYKGIISIIIFARDISNRVNIEKKLRKSNEKYEKLFNSLGDSALLGKYCEDTDSLNIVEANDAACKKLEYTREELLEKTIEDIVEKSAYEQLLCEIEKNPNDRVRSFGSVELSKSGKLIPVEVNLALLDLDGVRYGISVSRDISSRIEYEQKLKESEERYRNLIENFPYAIYIGNKGKPVFINKISADFFGVNSAEELLNKDISSMISPLNMEEVQEKIRLVLENGGVEILEGKVVRKYDNASFDVECSITKIQYEKEDAYMIIARDISAKKQAEELQRSIEEKIKLLNEMMEYERLRTDFFANISHELRTPINVILATLQLFSLKLNALSDKGIHNKTRKQIAIMKQNCYRLIRLINNLIDATKIDSGYFEVELSNNNIISVVEEITLSVAEYIENKGISIIFDTDVEEKIIACDPDKIERIMLNLISNAIKFTEVGGNIFVNIQDKGSEIEISVKDTGIGIPEDKLKGIFQRFVQVDKSLTRNSEGSGIGLSLVKSLVELQNGSIKVDSKQGEGSEFIIKFPVNILPKEIENMGRSNHNIQGNIEKINIEFSDIYFC